MKPGWFKMPLAPAAPWLELSACVRMLGRELFCMWQDGVIAGVSLESIEDVALRALSPDPRERKTLRAAVRTIIERGLLVAVDGGVQLLYSPETYADHRRKVVAPSTDGSRKVDGQCADGRRTPIANTAESLDRDLQKIDRRKREEGVGDEPAAPPLQLLPHEPKPEPKPAKPRDEAKLLWAATLKAESSARKIPTPSIGGKVRDEVLRMVREHAANTGESFAASLKLWVAGGLDAHCANGKAPQWALKDFRPYAPVHPIRTPPANAQAPYRDPTAVEFNPDGSVKLNKLTHTW